MKTYSYYVAKNLNTAISLWQKPSPNNIL